MYHRPWSEKKIYPEPEGRAGMCPGGEQTYFAVVNNVIGDNFFFYAFISLYISWPIHYPHSLFHILGIVKENEPPARSDEYWNFENNCRLIIDTRPCISLNLKRYRLKALFIVYTSANLKGWNGNDAGAGTISPPAFFFASGCLYIINYNLFATLDES